jgi:hypothetical protein
MFPAKSTMPFNELGFVFQDVYGISLEGIIPNTTPVKFISEVLRSPNLRLNNTERILNITCVPTDDPEYQYYGNTQLLDAVHKIETDILTKQQSYNIKEDPSVLQPIKSEFNIPVSSADVFQIRDPDLIALLERADLNVPRILQVDCLECDLGLLFKKCESEICGVKSTWSFIYQGLMVDGKTTYFDIHH